MAGGDVLILQPRSGLASCVTLLLSVDVFQFFFVCSDRDGFQHLADYVFDQDE